MNDRILKMAHAALLDNSCPPTIPERCHNESELQDPLAIAEGFRRFLLNQPVEIRAEELLADRYRVNGCDYPSDIYRRGGHPNLSTYWNTCCSATHPNDLFYWGWTHVSLDYGYVLQNGMKAYIERIRASEKAHEGQTDKLRFLSAMQIALETVQARSNLVASLAKEKAACTEDEALKKQYLRLANALFQTPMEPARDFYEAIQCVWTLFCTAPDSLGRIDQYLYPFYRKDIDDGKISKAFALELLEELFVKVHESQVENRSQPHSGHNHLVVGGYLQNGEDGFNELSELILDAIAELPTFRPQASFRYTKKTTPETMQKIAAYNRRCPLIVFVNDEPRIEGMVRAGISREDAIEYTVLGCNEWAICGKSKLDLAHTNLMHSLKSLLFDHREEALTASSFDEFYCMLEKYLACDMQSILEAYHEFRQHEVKDINVLTSAFMDDCIEKAQSFTDCGSRYYGISISFNGISNMADSLSVIRDFVFERKELTMQELLAVLDANWQGYEGLRNRIMKQAHFFGNDDPYADSLAQRVVCSIDAIRENLSSQDVNLLVCGSFVGATNPNIIFGKTLPATPDGRYQGEEMTMGISQTGGRDREGMTALLKSIACLDYSRFCGCVVSNIKIDPKMADSPEKLTSISQLFHTFLKLGGMQLQINYITNEELYQAQENPDDYANLMVRVTGYSGYFTLFDRDMQNDIIKRTEQRDG